MYPTAHVKSLLVPHNPLLTARPQCQSAFPTPERQHQTPVFVPFKLTYGKNNLQPLQALETDSVWGSDESSCQNSQRKGSVGKAPAVKPDDLSSILSTYMVEGEN